VVLFSAAQAQMAASGSRSVTQAADAAATFLHRHLGAPAGP
jgi:hypothetical protein